MGDPPTTKHFGTAQPQKEQMQYSFQPPKKGTSSTPTTAPNAESPYDPRQLLRNNHVADDNGSQQSGDDS